ncbi:MarP family serine protease [Rhizohabitans arisaemae]|uniref:MarP family serine protease n=1 Tax=Rhizohabitans arisaemae TaxID=2720610 RepID=UPI0024B211D0|nr:MarP family serine protease [Rhizohabitans arisaemae]
MYLDLILLALVVLFAISGYRQGFIIGVLSLVGFVGGGLLGVTIAPPIAGLLVTGETEQALVAIVVVFLTATIGQFASSTIGAVVRSHVTWDSARAIDAIGGTLASTLSVLLIAWLMASALVLAPIQMIRQQVTSSQMIKAINSVMPQGIKDLPAAFKQFVDNSAFPQVFDALGGGPFVEVPEPDQSVVRSPELQRARRGIVKVEGTAPDCGKRIEGTGFVYAPQRVMTNAHVVAGVKEELQVSSGGVNSRTFPAKVVLFNPERDIAILWVPGLPLPALQFDGSAESRDTAIVAGFPRGQGWKVEAARIRAKHTAIGPNIYQRGKNNREVYAIRGLVQPGNSGGPLLSPTGKVYGVVFAAAKDHPETGYALTAAEVQPDAQAGSNATRAVSTKTCD